ncbi:MAG: carbohydrate kinase family protein [Candidatus Promineifilaceae bacterium]|nr:carbohydrate kinase family protein [Candidatus Promineifilaceae bacterium]
MNIQPFDVVVVGNVGVDTNVYLPGADIDFGVEANFTENLDTVGQAGGYSARGFARLGWRTAFIGAVGDDHNGRFIRQELSADGIDLSGLFIDPSGSGRSVNFMYRDGRRKNFYDGKGHMTLNIDVEACRPLLAGARLVHFSIPNWARQLLPVARELGLPISVDVQDVVEPDDPYRRDFIDQADILFFSAVNHPDPRPLFEYYLARRPEQILVCGLGARGAALATREGVRFYEAVELPDPVVDSNGAGDSLAVGVLSSYVLGDYPLEDALLRGQIAARHACSLRADSSHLITAPQLDGLFARMRLSR